MHFSIVSKICVQKYYKNTLFISGNVFAVCGLLLIGIGITAFQSLTSLYKYLSQFATLDHQTQIHLNTVLIIGGVMIVERKKK